MKILINQGIFDMRNIGQIAMLQIAVERIRKNWPDASIEIITTAPNLLRLYFPGTIPVHPNGKAIFTTQKGLANRIIERLPGSMVQLILVLRETIWHRFPAVLTRFRTKRYQSDSADQNIEIESEDNLNPEPQENVRLQALKELVSGYDLVVATGSQYLTDISKDAGTDVLECLDAAIEQGIPTALVGQGIGPIEDLELINTAKTILPKVGMIFVREKLFSPTILESSGVDPAHVFVTGDDAVEIAYREKNEKLGSEIGLSLRVAFYTELNDKELRIIGDVIKRKAEKNHSQIISLPISHSLHERDDRHIKELISGYKNTWLPQNLFPRPEDIIRDTQRCRLVVTGTYHAAVFALGQGIPVICLVKGASYIKKLSGLADLFGQGCVVIDMNEENFEQKFEEAFERIWNTAELFKSDLLDAAALQINWGRQAYHENLFNLINPLKKGEIKSE